MLREKLEECVRNGGGGSQRESSASDIAHFILYLVHLMGHLELLPSRKYQVSNRWKLSTVERDIGRRGPRGGRENGIRGMECCRVKR